MIPASRKVRPVIDLSWQLPLFLLLAFTGLAGREKVREFSGDNLLAIAFPIGGIGTGNITLGGRGNVQEMEIFNRPAKNVMPEMTFFAGWAKTQGGEPVAMVLERQYLPPFAAAHGYPRQQLSGLPRFREARFRGEFPFAWIEMIDKRFPAQVTLEAYNPLVPLDAGASSLPAAIFNWHVKNPGREPLSVSLVFSMQNPIKTRGAEWKPGFNRNLNRCRQEGGIDWIEMGSNQADKHSPDYGTIAFAAAGRDTDVQTRWYRGGWWDGAHVFWDDFAADGRLTSVRDELEAPAGASDVASLLVHLELAPGEEALVPYYLTWCFPNRQNDWNSENEVKNKPFRNRYAARFADATAALRYLLQNLAGLEAKTRLFHDLLFASTYPGPVLDAVSSQISSLKTNLVIEDEKGEFYGWEGLGDSNSCCFGSCTHVWNYEQTLAYLFPSLERRMREIAFLNDTFANGYQTFRTLFPPGNYWWKFKPAADGQMGNIVRVYREWKLAGDTDWLRKMWPAVRAALEFAWKGVGEVGRELAWQKELLAVPWDGDKDGVMEGEQHNTYDIEFYGPNTMTGALYLAALKAGAEMATAMGEGERAAEYSRLWNTGSRAYDALLWNGDYYIQKVSVTKGLQVPEELASPQKTASGMVDPKYQYGQGCLSDQLLGQYLAFVAGLGYVLPSAHVDKALDSIQRYNFKQDLSAFPNVQRIYAINGEAGLLLCTWPQGNRPLLPFVYSDEVWTGIEYQVAASLIYTGRVAEGLAIVNAVRGRYAGFNRNPWDEFECGHHYARAMSSWALLLALSGFGYDGVKGWMEFAPRISRDDFSTFWSTGSAWGSFKLGKNRAELAVAFGAQKLTKLSMPAAGARPGGIRAEIDGKRILAVVQVTPAKMIASFGTGIEIATGKRLVLQW